MFRRVIFLLCFSFLMLVSISSQAIHGWTQDIDPESSLSFWGNAMELVAFGDPPVIHKTNYDLHVIGKVPFLNFMFPEDDQRTLPVYFQGSNRWLVLYGDGFLYAYESDLEQPIRNGFTGPNSSRLRKCKYIASSSLKEKDTIYSASNLGDFSLKKPWVEGVPGYGIGEYILITQDGKEAYFRELLISIGFVSYDNPFLYEQNSRPRLIELTTKDGTLSCLVELQDTPNIQIIKLPKPVKDLKVLIRDVYKGTKWDDTCINFMVPLL